MSEFHPIIPDKLLFRSRQMRRDSTHPERRLWNCLRAGRLGGLKFRRQHAIGPFVVDFYCHDCRLAVELDGDSHNDRGKYDLRREDKLKSENIRVVRFANDDVLRDLESVLRSILVSCGFYPDSALALPLGEGRGEGGSHPASDVQQRSAPVCERTAQSKQRENR